ncbi:MAG TPA: SGNH/GDSL hydrolase family protein [Pseudoxanthomonas sp.]|nr:SGNH/GDSL hydrolase family protein [Pseudoxanthomonas sp.]
MAKAARFGVLAMLAAAGTLVAQDAPVATDPLFVAPADSLGPEQVRSLQQRLADWPQLGRYREDNAALPPPAKGERRVVFYGDSITDGWGRVQGTTFFPGKPYVNRGISGQTTAQMLLRFRQDVIELKPAAVVILAGTNDIAGNTGVATQAMIEENLQSMAELARAHGIRVVLASVLPVSDYPWRPGLQPADKVRRLNAWIGDYARRSGATYLDYWSALANAQGGMDAKLAADGVHPTPAGYAVMAPLAQKAIDRALAK